MCWAHGNSLLRFHIDPSARNAAARKNQRVRPLLVDDGKFEIAVERGRRYRLPFHDEYDAVTRTAGFDLDHDKPLPARRVAGGRPG
jgi:hypothetical protein